MKKLLVFMVVFLFVSTGFSQQKQTKHDSCNSCLYFHLLPGSAGLIQDSINTMFTQKDYDSWCLVYLIDSLKSLFVNTGKIEYLKALDSIACHSDGYVSEALDGDEMLYARFKTYVDFLYHNKDTNNCLVMFLRSAVGYYDFVYDSTHSVNYSKTLDYFIRKKERRYNMPKGERLFLDKVLYVPNAFYAQHKSDMVNNCKSCSCLFNFPKSLRIIKDSTASLFTQQDLDCSCLFELIDTLRNSFIRTGNTEYLSALEKMADQSDGAVSEEFEGDEMLYGKFKLYIDYLYNNGDTNNILTSFLEDGIMYDCYVASTDSDGAKTKWDPGKVMDFITKQEDKYKMPVAERKFMDVIMKKAEEYYEDGY